MQAFQALWQILAIDDPNPISYSRLTKRKGTMKTTPEIKKILDAYEADNPKTKENLARILMQGKLGGTGKTRHPPGRPRL